MLYSCYAYLVILRYFNIFVKDKSQGSFLSFDGNKVTIHFVKKIRTETKVRLISIIYNWLLSPEDDLTKKYHSKQLQLKNRGFEPPILVPFGIVE